MRQCYQYEHTFQYKATLGIRSSETLKMLTQDPGETKRHGEHTLKFTRPGRCWLAQSWGCASQQWDTRMTGMAVPQQSPTFQCYSSGSEMQDACVCPGQNTWYLYIHTQTGRGSLPAQELRCQKSVSSNTSSSPARGGRQAPKKAAPLLPAQRADSASRLPPQNLPLDQAEASQGFTAGKVSEM